MSTLAFDTHKAVKALKDAGFAEAQAEAVVSTVGDAVGGNVATKEDLLKTAVGIVIANVTLTIALLKLIL